MNNYMCTICGFIYNEETAKQSVEGNAINFEDIIDSDVIDEAWKCPNCGAKKRFFEKINPGNKIINNDKGFE